MGTLTQGLFNNQAANNWFSGLSELERGRLLEKYNIDKSITDGTLTNGEVLKVFRNEHETK